MNKRGMMDDMFDFLFTVIVSFFLLFFLSMILNSGVERSQDASLDRVGEVKMFSSAISNLRVNYYNYNLEIDPDNVDEIISNTQVVGGKTITTCSDYLSPDSCAKDLAKVGDTFCDWHSSGFCYYNEPVPYT